jgi:hypothetical protein
METLGNEIMSNINNKYCCEKCQYRTSRKSSYDDHLMSSKHKKAINGNKTNAPVNVLSTLVCEKCQKQFNSRSGLWKHKKNCNTASVTDSNTGSFDKDQLIMLLIKQNADLMKETTEIKNTMKELILLTKGSDSL